jgi:hypothetical protein
MANPNWKLALLRALLIVAAVFWVFSPSIRGDWLMDDDFYLPQNALVGDPDRLWKIWFVPGSLLEYYPIEASLQAAQWHFWHLNTLGYHLTNIVLHLLGALLVWRLLAKFGLRNAWIGGLLFAIHPAVVESVAWISEFKNTLSLAPFLLAMRAWIDFEERGRQRDYLLALGLFLIAMLGKISMAPFPFVILLYAWWKRGRIGWNDLKNTLPFGAISIVLGSTTILAGNWFRHAHLQSAANPPIGDFATHIALAGQSMAFYFSKAVFPVDMIFIYPKWPIEPTSPLSYWPWLVLVAAIYWFWMRRASWGRHAILGLGFFLLNLAPFIGLTSVTYMEFTWVMDHFLYIPLIGLIGLAIAALDQLETEIPATLRQIEALAMAVVLSLLAWESHDYAETFIGPEILWTRTLAHNPNSYLPYNNLGVVMLETNRIPEAIEEYRKALQLHPTMVEAHNNLGRAYALNGQIPEAIEQYEEALKYNPHSALAHANLGNALLKVGRAQEAIDHFQQALKTDPRNADAIANLTKLKAMPPNFPPGE